MVKKLIRRFTIGFIFLAMLVVAFAILAGFAGLLMLGWNTVIVSALAVAVPITFFKSL